MGLFYYARKIPAEAVYASSARSPALNRKGPAENGFGLEQRWGAAGTVVGRFEGDGYRLELATAGASGDRYTRYNRPVELWGSGTDCLGFAQQAASYRDNPYEWLSLSRQDLEPLPGNEPVYRVFPRIDGDEGGDGVTYSDAVVTRKEFDAPGADVPSLLSRIRPGDIMYYAPGHIAIVQQVQVNEEGLVEGLGSIQLIESVFAGRGESRFANVVNTQTLADYSSRSWRLVRLRMRQ
jgi:hypothetical protein